jgi:hypothetical protein
VYVDPKRATLSYHSGSVRQNPRAQHFLGPTQPNVRIQCGLKYLPVTWGRAANTRTSLVRKSEISTFYARRRRAKFEALELLSARHFGPFRARF